MANKILLYVTKTVPLVTKILVSNATGSLLLPMQHQLPQKMDLKKLPCYLSKSLDEELKWNMGKINCQSLIPEWKFSLRV